MDATFTEARIVVIKTQIVALETAISAFIATGLVQSYTLDTGQNRQVVTRANLVDQQNLLKYLENTLAVLQTRLTGSGTTRVIPSW